MIQDIKNKIRRTLRFVVCSLLPLAGGGWMAGACSDFFDQESDRVIYSNTDHLNSWVDTTYSVTGILNKLQVIADRTILLGEVRGDLVQLTADADNDLRQLATFTVDDDNQYNQPRDYYAVINNCNYFLAHADTALKSNRNQYIFMKEYAAVKAIRAWTYLQLVLNYGSVPFVTEPILTKEESERDYPAYDLEAICRYFIADLESLPVQYDYQYPDYGTNVRGNYSRVLFFPLNIVRGDLYLWLASIEGRQAGQPHFLRAAMCYYKYITTRNGLDSYYPVGTDICIWEPGTTSWSSFLTVTNNFIGTGSMIRGWYTLFGNETYNSSNSELITMIAGDSIRAEGYYSELRNLFNSTADNDYKASITPSTALVELSEAQVNLTLASNLRDSVYAPTDLTNHLLGDLRLYNVWYQSERTNDMGTRISVQQIYKYTTRNVHIYRRQMVYLRFAEALNLAGYPRLAYKILERGLSNTVISSEVTPYLSAADAAWVSANIDFPNENYRVLNAGSISALNLSSYNTMGIHTRGSGWTPMNEYYRLVDGNDSCLVIQPDSSLVFDDARYEVIKARQMEQVDSLILNENALECCFEGTRYYDLMRYALRADNPGRFMADHIYARRGSANTSAVQAEIPVNLADPANWYLRWKGKIGR